MTRKRVSDKDLVASTASAAVPARRKPTSPARKKHVAAPAESAPQTVASAPVDGPSFEQIAQLAYTYWEARGCQGGSSEEDWLRAEQELRLTAVSQ